jgi:two-component system sensor histidine kinase/response regulator
MKDLNFDSQTENKSIDQLKEINESMEKEWIEGNKKLLAIIGHDVKTPMSTIVSFLILIKNKVFEWDRDKIKTNIDITLFAAEKTISLLDDILEWGMSVNISKSFQPEVLDFSKIVNDEIETLRVFTLQKKIEITSFITTNDEVFADKNMIKSILRNLLNNAIKYSKKSGKIEISTTRNEKFLEITIQDYGIGMSDEVISALFITNNHNTEPGTYNEPGNGFGLLLCKEFVDIHEGEIRIESKSGEGSKVIFTLPLYLKP